VKKEKLVENLLCYSASPSMTFYTWEIICSYWHPGASHAKQTIGKRQVLTELQMWLQKGEMAALAYLIHLNLIILIKCGKEYKWRSSSLYTFLHPVSSFLSPIILRTCNLCWSFSMRNQIVYPYKTAGRLQFMFLDRRQDGKRFWAEFQHNF
jgi:hypothetical protein